MLISIISSIIAIVFIIVYLINKHGCEKVAKNLLNEKEQLILENTQLSNDNMYFRENYELKKIN